MKPSSLVAVTVKVCRPGVEVQMSAPEGQSFWSWQLQIPGPPQPSQQEKLESTLWFSL